MNNLNLNNSLLNIYKNDGKYTINRLFNLYVIILENIDGYEFAFQKLNGSSFIYYKNNFEKIDYLDRVLTTFYEKPINYIENLPKKIKENIPINWVFRFKYLDFSSIFLNDRRYYKIPKNGLILTDIYIKNESGKIKKYINDINVLNKWANRLDVEVPPIIFSGKLNSFQKEQLLKILEMPLDDLAEIFKEQSFVKHIISILNPNLLQTKWVDNLEGVADGIIFKFIDNENKNIIEAELINPFYYYKIEMNKNKKEENENNKLDDIYQIILLDIIEFINSKLDIEDLKVNGENYDERYVDLISKIFNKYITKNIYKYIGLKFNERKDLKGGIKFNLNIEKIPNFKTKNIIENNKHLKELYKFLLEIFSKKQRGNNLDGILTSEVKKSFNEIINKIKNKIELKEGDKNINDLLNIDVDNNKNEMLIDKDKDLLDFDGFLKSKKSVKENNNKINYDDIYEGLNLIYKERGSEKVNIVVGRFQPFTLGHIKIFETLYKKNRLPVVVLLVRAKNKKIDLSAPFNEDLQIELFKVLQKEYSFLRDIFTIKTASISMVLNVLRPDYEPVLWGAGTDRYLSYKRMIERYREEANLLDDFDIFEIKRDDEDISATKVRNALLEDDYITYKKLVPKSMYSYYDKLKEIIDAIKINTI